MPNVKIDPNDIAIRLKGLKKSFGPQTVLEDVNLDIRRGETMVIIGKSGGGKSVILKHMIGLLHEGMHVLGGHIHRERSGGKVVQNAPQSRNDFLRLFFGDNALFPEHRGVGDRTLDILADQTLIERDRGVERFRRLVDLAACPSCPEFCHITSSPWRSRAPAPWWADRTG